MLSSAKSLAALQANQQDSTFPPACDKSPASGGGDNSRRILTKDFESDDHSAKTIEAAPLLVIEGLGDLAGDVDGDGDVDDDDLSLVLANWGQDTDRAHGELSGTPPVNDDDLSLLLASWTGAAAVPEPATIAMLIAAPVLWRLRRRT